MNETLLDTELIKAFGIQIEDDLEIIKRKISAVIAAHLFAGDVGDNPLASLNRIMKELCK